MLVRVASATARRGYATAVNAGGAANPDAYCRVLVRKHDYDSFLTSYFYPRRLQPGYLAIRAFNVELATVKEQVSSVTIGKMRMQFWRDAIKSIYNGKPPQHPVAVALHQTLQVADIPAYHFKRIIDARDADLENPTHMTLESLRAYAESTSSTTFYALLHLLSLHDSSEYSHAVSHLGVAHSLSILLRALPFHASQSRLVIPTEITAKHRVSQEEVFRQGGSAAGISDAAFEFACVAKEELDVAREHIVRDGKIPGDVLPIFLSGVPVSNYLSRLEAVNFDTFDPSLHKRDWRLPFQIWRARRQNLF
ncbi:hypothetical protein DL93DRAFT_278866 [Clavulina sp. PMI_390]|nr:hypothetical protein DL93DRAFT_278866 [Clavulina sp. PMI_390]